MIFISAGHVLKGADKGASGNGYKEAEVAAQFRDLIIAELKRQNASFVTDTDTETLTEYTNRIKTGSGSVVCEIHLNASDNAQATGIETVVPTRYTTHEYNLAKEISQAIQKHTGLPLRGDGKKGVITEAQTARKSLLLFKEDGINVLVELGFISNVKDMQALLRVKPAICIDIAMLLIRYDALIK